MIKGNMVLATYSNGREITADMIDVWIANSDRAELANFLFERLYTRYIKPFDFPNSEYEANYKNGFAIMANCCLLIETFISFTIPELKDTHKNSERCFGAFFTTYSNFSDFAVGGLKTDDYIRAKPLQKVGIPHDFYSNVRCGILHNGETRSGWKIRRHGDLFNKQEKVINATLFMKSLHSIIEQHKITLENSDFSTTFWQAYINRLKFLLSKL